jgi:hypothetical protein
VRTSSTVTVSSVILTPRMRPLQRTGIAEPACGDVVAGVAVAIKRSTYARVPEWDCIPASREAITAIDLPDWDVRLLHLNGLMGACAQSEVSGHALHLLCSLL